jgi:hypothetical protein
MIGSGQSIKNKAIGDEVDHLAGIARAAGNIIFQGRHFSFFPFPQEVQGGSVRSPFQHEAFSFHDL